MLQYNIQNGNRRVSQRNVADLSIFRNGLCTITNNFYPIFKFYGNLKPAERLLDFPDDPSLRKEAGNH
jgi:hypothetical protein